MITCFCLNFYAAYFQEYTVRDKIVIHLFFLHTFVEPKTKKKRTKINRFLQEQNVAMLLQILHAIFHSSAVYFILITITLDVFTIRAEQLFLNSE